MQIIEQAIHSTREYVVLNLKLSWIGVLKISRVLYFFSFTTVFSKFVTESASIFGTCGFLCDFGYYILQVMDDFYQLTCCRQNYSCINFCLSNIIQPFLVGTVIAKNTSKYMVPSFKSSQSPKTVLNGWISGHLWIFHVFRDDRISGRRRIKSIGVKV